MYLTAQTLDDLLRQVLERLLIRKTRIIPTRGSMREIPGVLLRLRNPRARLSHTETKGHVFSCLGELLWYLAKSRRLDLIEYYISRYREESEDGRTVYGAYGPRLFDLRGNDQVGNVITQLKRHPESRRAVIQLFDAADLAKERREIPCTSTLQFMIRRNRLIMFATMRSNDAFKGLPHDVFAFTMIQELIARSMNLEIGPYSHFVSSLHLYDSDITRAGRYIKEGWQPTTSMPAMPIGDPWPAIKLVLKAEKGLRKNGVLPTFPVDLDPYWADLIRILQIFRYSKDDEITKIRTVKAQMHSPVFNAYIQKRQRRVIVAAAAEQLEIPFTNTPRSDAR